MATDLVGVGTVVSPSDVWGTDIRMRLPSADTGAIDLEIANTVQEFLQKSGAMALETSQDLVAGEKLYDFATIPVTFAPDGAQFTGITGLFCHAVRLEDGSFLRIVQHRPRSAYSANPHHGVPTIAYVPNWPGTVELFPVPSDKMDGQKLTVLTSVILLRPIVTVPRLLSVWNYNAILDGATGRMMSHPKRPYSDPRLAEYYLRRFRNEMRVASDEARRKWSNAESEFRYNPDWARKVQLR